MRFCPEPFDLRRSHIHVWRNGVEMNQIAAGGGDSSLVSPINFLDDLYEVCSSYIP